MEINLRSPAIMEINKSRFCVFKNWLSCFAGGSHRLHEEMLEKCLSCFAGGSHRLREEMLEKCLSCFAGGSHGLREEMLETCLMH